MKQLIAAAVLGTLSALTLTAVAQPHGDPEARIERRVEHMSERLGLDETQQAQLEDLLRTQSAKRRALREDTRNQLRGILTEEQIAQMEAQREARKGKGRHGKHRQHGRHHGDETCGKDVGIQRIQPTDAGELKGVSL